VLTWAVETLASSDIKNDPSDGEQDPPVVVPVELCECAWAICGEAERGSMPEGHPRVASFAFCGERAWDGGDGKENAPEGVEEAYEQKWVDRVRKQGRRHLAEVVGKFIKREKRK
jgi:hypothetical protein